MCTYVLEHEGMHHRRGGKINRQRWEDLTQILQSRLHTSQRKRFYGDCIPAGVKEVLLKGTMDSSEKVRRGSPPPRIGIQASGTGERIRSPGTIPKSYPSGAAELTDPSYSFSSTTARAFGLTPPRPAPIPRALRGTLGVKASLLHGQDLRGTPRPQRAQVIVVSREGKNLFRRGR